MKQGRTLQELAVELDRQKDEKKDYIVPPELLTLENTMEFSLMGKGKFEGTNLAHEQVATHLKIPKVYYDRMKLAIPELLAYNVNSWLHRETEPHLVRILDNKMRAFLSKRYRPLDNYDLARVILPKLNEMQCRVESCEITETRMYIKAVTERITTDITVGDPVQAGIVISNSEVGCGSVRIEPLIYILSCLNGMIVTNSSLRKYHVGRGFDIEENVYELLRDETRKADDKAFFMKVGDVANATLTQFGFEKIVEEFRRTKEITITGAVPKVIEEIALRYTLTEFTENSILTHLIAGGQLNKFGVIQAVTRSAQDEPDYDKATQLERIGGEILELPQNDWEKLNLN